MMRTNQYLSGLVSEYQTIYKGEDAYVSSLLFNQLDDDKDMFDRKNFTGHITASGLVLNQTFDKILLINHKFLQMWLQPGGHVEGDAEIYKEAKREITEETALLGFGLHPWHHQNDKLPDVPFSIDSHDIPASPHKNEEPHVHHDFTYLFVGNSNQKLRRQVEEVTGAEWYEIAEITNLKTDVHKYIERIQAHII
ncbi:MAG: hypothetical protein COB24_13910 [Hyphomicrobiales bacterium]|nr:MAG: hypothetical protein COB24_13910 [Hyphomicrobiales bacterium]